MSDARRRREGGCVALALGAKEVTYYLFIVIITIIAIVINYDKVLNFEVKRDLETTWTLEAG